MHVNKYFGLQIMSTFFSGGRNSYNGNLHELRVMNLRVWIEIVCSKKST